jgi:ABC-type sulfate transport system permease subunit
MAGAAHIVEDRRHVPVPVRVARWVADRRIGRFLGLLLLAPLATVLAQALSKGFATYFHSFADTDTRAAIKLTLLTAAIVVPLNTVFGIAAAWAIAKFEFSGKSLLITLIDLPFAISPVIAGLVFVLLFGAPAGSVRGCRTTTSRSSSRCRVSCSPRCWSRSRTWPAS